MTTGGRLPRAVRSSRAPTRAAPPAFGLSPTAAASARHSASPAQSVSSRRAVRVPVRKSGAQCISTRVKLSPVCWCATSCASATSSSSPLSSRRAGDPIRMRGRTMPASAMPGRSGTSVVQKRPFLIFRPESRTSRALRCQVAASLKTDRRTRAMPTCRRSASAVQATRRPAEAPASNAREGISQRRL